MPTSIKRTNTPFNADISSYDYSNVNPQDLLKDPFFRRDIMENANSQGMVDFTFEEALSEWYNEQSYASLNEIGALFGDAGYMGTSSLQGESRNRMARLTSAYQLMPNVLTTGARDGSISDELSASDITGTLAGANVLNPSNLVGGASAKAAAYGSLAAGKSTFQAAKTAGLAGAKSQLLAGAASEGTISIANQNRDMALGNQDEFSYLQAGASIGLGAVANYGIAFLIGAATTPLAKAKLIKNHNTLLTRGWSQVDIDGVATESGEEGLKEILSFESRAAFDEAQAQNQPPVVDGEAEAAPAPAPTVSSRENVDLDLEQLAEQRRQLDERMENIDTPPTAVERKEWDAEAKLIQALQDDASDVNRIHLEIDQINARITEGTDAETSAKYRADAQRLTDDARQKATNYKIRRAIFANMAHNESYIDALARYKKALAESEQKAAQAKAQAQEDAPQPAAPQPTPRAATPEAPAQPQSKPVAKTPIQEESIDVETAREIQEAEEFEASIGFEDTPEAPIEAAPTQPAPVQVIQPETPADPIDAALEIALQEEATAPVEVPADIVSADGTVKKAKKVKAPFSPRAKKFAQVALGVGEEIDLEKSAPKYRNQVAREILTAIDKDNEATWKSLNLNAKIERIDSILEEKANKAKIDVPAAPVTPAPVVVIPAEAVTPTPAKAVEPETKLSPEETETNSFKEAFELEAVKEFELPTKLAEFAAEQADPEAGQALATLFTSIVETGSEVALGDMKLMKSVINSIFGPKDAKAIMREYRKVFDEANLATDTKLTSTSKMAKADSNFEKTFIADYIAARKARVTSEVKAKFGGYWDNKQNRVIIKDLTETHTKAWRADAQEILRSQYNIRGASLAHWEMFSDIKPNKKASAAYIKAALRGELPESRKNNVDEGVVLSQDMAISHANKTQKPVAFLTTRSIGAKFVLTEGYPSGQYANGRHFIPAGQIVYYSPYDSKFYQSTRELLQASGRLAPEQRDSVDVTQFIDVGDFRDREKILGTGFHKMLLRYSVKHTTKKKKDATGKKVATKVDPYQRIGEMKEFIISRFLLEQEIQGRSSDTFFSLAKTKTDAIEVPAPKAKSGSPKAKVTLDEVSVPQGQRLALLSSNGQKIRVITDEQLEKGFGVNELLGKANPDEWEIGMVPFDSPRSSSLNKDMLIDLYQKLTDQPTRRMFADVAPNITDLENFKAKDFLEESEFDWVLENYKTISQPNIDTKIDRSMAEIAQMLAMIDGNMRIRDGEFDVAFDTVNKSLEMQKKYFPQGIGRTTQGRYDSISQARKMLAGYGPDEKASAAEVLEALGKGNTAAVESLILRMTGAVDTINPKNGAPVFGKEYNSTLAGSHSTNETGKSIIAVNPDSATYPKFAVLLHEVAHWAYLNAMTPEMRMEFWGELKGAVYTDGKVDPTKLEMTTGHSKVEDGGSLIHALQLDNSRFSPQEYFANAFQKWALNNRHSDLLDIKYWKKLTNFIASLFEKIQGKESGSPKLDAIFARLYPDNTAANRQAKKYVDVFSPTNPPKHVVEAESTAQFVLRQRLAELESVWETFSGALNDSGTPAGAKSADIIYDARVLARTLNSLSMTRNESRILSSYGLENDPILGSSGTNSTEGGALRILAKKGYAKKMRELARGINTIVTRNLSGDMNQGVLPTEKFDYDEFNVIVDHYEGGRELTPEMVDFVEIAGEIAGVDKDLRATEMLDDIFIFMETNQVSAEDFDSGLSLERYNADPLGHKEAAANITELINANRDLIDGAGQVIADSYYQFSKQNYAIRVPLDKSLKQEHFTGKKPMTKKRRDMIAGINKRAGRTKPAVSAMAEGNKQSFADLNQEALAAKHQEALDSGDMEAIDAIYYEAYRRAEADSVHALSGDAAIKSGQVQHAIDMENIGKVDGEGIWSDAPLTIRDSAKMMTHRDPEVQANMRLMFQRMYGLINASTRGITDDIPLIDLHTLGKITGENYNNVDGAVRDLSTAKFGALRSDFRRIVIGLNREDSDPKALMHEIGHIFKRALPQDNLLVIRDAFKKAIDAEDPVAVQFAGRYEGSSKEDMAEEWFVESWANYLANRVSKESIISSKLDYTGNGELKAEMLEVKGKLGQYLDLLSEYVMYGLNGLIGRDDVKQMFRRLTFSGNLIQRQTILGNMANHHVPSEYLSEFAAQAIQDLPTDGRANLKGFVKGTISGMGDRILPLYYATTGRMSASIMPDNFMGKQRLSGAIYVATTPESARKIFTDPKVKARPYDRKELVDAATRIAERNDLDAEGAIKYVLDQVYRLETLMAARHSYIGESIRVKDAMNDPALANISARNKVAYKEMTEKVEFLNGEISVGIEIFETRFGITPIEHNAVVVSSVAPHEVATFSAGTSLNETNRNVFNDILAIITPTVKEADYRLLSGRLNAAPTAAHAFKVLSEVSGSDTSIPKALRELGFKAAIMTTDEGDDLIALLTSAQVKRLNDPEFTNPESVAMLNETSTLSTVTGGILNHTSALEEGVKLTPAQVAQAVASMIEKNGGNSATADTISQVTRGYVGRGESAKKFLGGFKETFSRLLSENSVQIRAGGMNWLGNLIKPENGVGHFEKHGSRVGKKVMPILSLIQKINGPEKGAGRRYLDRVNQWGYKPSVGEARVLKAMRRPAGSPYETRLRGDERKLYDMLRAQFKNELEEMRGQGLFVGKIKNYLPQVWDINMIMKNEEEFLVKMAAYFKSEARNSGDELSEALAVKRAESMVARLTDDDGVYIPSRPKEKKDTDTDHLDFSRVIRLDEFPKHLDDLEGFLVNDLGGITTKYFNESSRRILLTKDFGIESHAFYDYMEAHENGINGAAKLLASGKVYRRPMESFDGEVVTVLESQLMMPIARNEVHGKQLLTEALGIMKTSGLPAAKEHLMSLALKRQPALERRIDAILTAFAETGGQTTSATTDYKHAYGMFDTLRGRSPSRGGIYNSDARKYSKYARMFNSVSLLSYTVVTSMTDLVLPIIRSGSMVSAMKGLKKINLDPDYRTAVRNVGAGMASIAHNKLVHMSGGEGDKLSNAFFSGIGLNQWTEYMRDYAASTAYEAIKAEQRIAIRSMRGDGTDMSKQGADFRRAKRFLARVGLGHFAEKGADSLDNMKLLENDQVREAIHRMTNEAVFAPNGNDIPLIWQSPLGAVLFQFKSFPLMMGRLARRALWDEVGKPMLTKGEPINIAPAAMLLSLAPLFGEQVLSLRDTITAKGGEEGGEYKRRERSANKFLESFGADEDDPVFESDQMDALAGRYVEGFMFAGGFGLLADLLHQSAEQVDNGAYGSNRIASTFLGPSYGAVFGTGVNIVAGASDDNDDSNSKERQAWREIIGRIPLVGQNRQIKEDAVDYLGGKATR